MTVRYIPGECELFRLRVGTGLRADRYAGLEARTLFYDAVDGAPFQLDDDFLGQITLPFAGQWTLRRPAGYPMRPDEVLRDGNSSTGFKVGPGVRTWFNLRVSKPFPTGVTAKKAYLEMRFIAPISTSVTVDLYSDQSGDVPTAPQVLDGGKTLHLPLPSLMTVATKVFIGLTLSVAASLTGVDVYREYEDAVPPTTGTSAPAFTAQPSVMAVPTHAVVRHARVQEE